MWRSENLVERRIGRPLFSIFWNSFLSFSKPFLRPFLRPSWRPSLQFSVFWFDWSFGAFLRLNLQNSAYSDGEAMCERQVDPHLVLAPRPHPAAAAPHPAAAAPYPAAKSGL